MALKTSLLPSGHETPPSDPRGASWYAWLLILPAVFRFLSYGTSLLTLPLVMQSWGMNLANVAYLKSVKEFSDLVANVPASAVLMRFGTRGTMLIGSALYGIVGLGLGLAPNYAILALFYWLQGVVTKVYKRGQVAVLKDAGQKRGRLSGALVTCRVFALAVAPQVTAHLALPLGGAQHVFFLQVGFGLAMFLFAATSPTPPSPTPKAATQTPARSSKPSGDVGYAALLADSETRGDLLLSGVSLCAVSMVRGAYNITLPMTCLTMGLSPARVSVYMTAAYGTTGALSYIAGYMFDHIGMRPCVVTAMALYSAAHGSLAMATTTPESAVSGAVVASVAAFGVADAICAPLSLAVKGAAAAREDARLCERGFPEDESRARTARFMAALDSILDANGIVWPIVLGQVAARISVSVASAAFAFIAVGAGATAFRILRGGDVAGGRLCAAA